MRSRREEARLVAVPATSQQEASDPVSDPVSRPAWPRAGIVWGVGTVLICLNAFFGAYIFVVVQALLWTQTSLLRGPLVGLFFIVLANFLLLRFARRRALTQAEMLLLYSMLCVSTCAGGVGFVQMLISQIAGPFYYATASNGWHTKLWPYLPLWMAPRQPDVLKGFYQGNSTLYSHAALSAWAGPVAAWTAFIFALFWVLLCMVTLVRRRWVEEERLTFPLVYLPVEMSQQAGAGPFWKSRAMWTGFLVAGLVESLNYLSYLYPSLPSLPIKPVGPNQIDLLLTARPWNAAGMLRLAFYPFAIGIGYVLSLEVSFSCWSLYLCAKLANVFCSAVGLSEGGGGGGANRAPFLREQAVGAFLGLALFSIWMARGPLTAAWEEMAGRNGRNHATSDNEVMPFRLALIGGGIGVAFLVGFLVVAGLSLPVALLMVFVYLCFALALARIVSEVGAGWAFAPNWSPAAFTMDTFGADRLSPVNVTMLSGGVAWTSDMRDNPLPQMTQAMKLGSSSGAPLRAFFWPLVWASLFGTLCAFWAHLHIYYEYGAATAKVRPWLASMGLQQANSTANLLATRTPRDAAGFLAAGFGLAAVIACSQLRLRYAWWPFHPLGYALATTNSLDYMWFPFFIAWLVKSLVVRYGSIKMYRATLPFFLGLTLGDYVVPTLWGVWGMISGQQQYMAFPH